MKFKINCKLFTLTLRLCWLNYLLKRRPQPFLYCYCRNFSSGGFSHLNTMPFSSKPSHTFRLRFLFRMLRKEVSRVYGGPQLSRQNQKPHGKNKNITAKPKTSCKTKNVTAKQKTSRQNQILHSKSKIALVLPWVFAFAVRYFRVLGF